MLQQERLHRIKSLLNRLQRVSTERIMKDLNISRETARRDIIELELLGICKRVHGGIISFESIGIEPPLKIRNTHNAKEKRAISRLAVQQLKSDLTIFIDAGSTTSMFAEELNTLTGITIITNSIQAVLNLTSDSNHNENQVILLGGHVQQRPQTQGDLVIREIERYHADLAVLSPVGISHTHGASSFYIEEANIAQAMVKNSNKTLILADHSKLNVISRVQYAKVNEITTLITDKAAQLDVEFHLFEKNFNQVLLA